MSYTKTNNIWAMNKILEALDKEVVRIPCRDNAQRSSYVWRLSSQRKLMEEKNPDVFSDGVLVIKKVKDSFDIVLEFYNED